MATKRIKRDAGTAWLEKTNPLKGLSISEAQAIFDNARQGDTQRLHWIFQEIESANPTLMTCVERRVSALAGIDWGVTVRPRADQSLGEEQQAAVEGFISTIENFDEMIEHLDIAFFRGFSYAQPLWEADGGVRHISLLDSWCFLTKDGRLFYNPVCDGFTRNCEEVTREAGLIGIRRRRWIDYPALSIHIRNAVGERDWGRFLERIALPKPAVIMGPNPTPEQRNDYVAVAEDVEDGKVSVWPYGTSLTDFMGGSRGQDPFSAFIRHQDEKIVLLSTGGTLTSLAQADTGALAGGAQMDVWHEIVAKDAKAVEGAVMRALVLPFLERKFPGRPCAIDFTFDRTKKLTAKESAEVAVALKNAGYLVVQSELEAATGFTLEKAPEPPAQPMPGLAMAKAKEDEPQAPRKALADTLQDALEAAMVEAIAGELQTAQARQGEKCPDCGQWLDANGICHECHGSDEAAKEGYNPDDAKMQSAQIGKGKAAISKCLSDHVDVYDAISRSDVGTISLIYGQPYDNDSGKAYGLAHLFAKHQDEGIVENLAESLIRGKIREPGKTGNKIAIDHKGYQIYLAKSFSRKGNPNTDKVTWVITGFKTDKEDA